MSDEPRVSTQENRCSCKLNITPAVIDPNCHWHWSWQILQEQAIPVKQDRPAIWDLVIQDMADRNAQGTAKYGTPLQAFNGRNALWDAYQEALDLCVYLRQRIEEDKESQ